MAGLGRVACDALGGKRPKKECVTEYDVTLSPILTLFPNMSEEDILTRYEGVIRTLLDQNSRDRELIRSNREEMVTLKEQWREAKAEWDSEKLELRKKVRSQLDLPFA